MAKHIAAERIGKRLRQERDRLGLTQYQAGQRLDVSDRTWQRWETGDSIPRGGNLVRIAKALEIDPEELFALRGEPLDDELQEQLDRIEAKVDRIESRLDPGDPLQELENDPEAPAQAERGNEQNEPSTQTTQAEGGRSDSEQR